MSSLGFAAVLELRGVPCGDASGELHNLTLILSFPKILLDIALDRYERGRQLRGATGLYQI
jgi:hypothetical protein